MRKKKRIHAKPRDLLPLQLTAVLLLVAAAFWNSLDGGFHFDDQGIFLDSHIVSPGFGWKILRPIQTRPLTFLTFHWNWLAGGAAPLGFHLVSVLLHAANSALVLLVARRAWNGSPALLAAALFAIHPLQTQAVNYVFQRATLLAAFFALLSLLLFLQERYSWSAAAFGLSLLAKEETIALPAFLLLIDFVRRRRGIPWRYYTVMLGLAALAAARLFYALHATSEAGLGFGTQGIPVISYALTQCRVVWIYLRLFVFPIGLNLDHDVTLSQGLLSPPATLPAVLLLAVFIGALAWLAWRESAPALWILGFFVLLAPGSSVIPAADLMFEHRTYLPLACLTIAAASLPARMHVRLRTPVLAVLLAALFGGTVMRNRVWHSEQSLWADVVKKSPRKARGYFHLGQAYASRDPGRARELYERGLEIEPRHPAGHTNLGLLLLWGGNPQAALVHFRQALALGGEKPLIWNNVGAAQVRLGEIEEGLRSFRRALESDPCRFDARLNLVRALSYLGDRETALLAGQVPEHCHLLPEQAQKLEDERRSLQ
jgi:tetratricopeptide (TPR) repeat protein